jgi:hypothetical protein
MKYVFAIALLAASTAFAQLSCTDCGVVRSVRSVTKQLPPSAAVEETKPSGLVASIPFKGGKAQIGSSEKIGRDAPTVVATYEVVVLMDDGKYRVVILDDPPDFKEGDRVRVDKGKLFPPK